MTRTFKIRVYDKKTNNFMWSEVFTTTKTEREIEAMIEGQKVNTNLFYYVIDEM